ncbi:MAG: aminotransferase class I/II-fold pyridoxal phosphate-dependent enzyme, partial [Clostridia bacterium]|nr:aminotransferase class I/II-fold pyridoxal phosphate-dependent enzyme [Clostridia bacterium]
MSRFFTETLSDLEPYVPGEQPRDKKYVKLNTNESPFPPSDGVLRAVSEEVGRLQLYSDPECTALREEMAKTYRLSPEWIVMSNGSDETLDMAFAAFADEKHPLVFPDITYGFYPVFARKHHIPFEEIPLTADFSVRPEDYMGIGKTVVLANPNAPTGKCLSLSEIEKIV